MSSQNNYPKNGPKKRPTQNIPHQTQAIADSKIRYSRKVSPELLKWFVM